MSTSDVFTAEAMARAALVAVEACGNDAARLAKVEALCVELVSLLSPEHEQLAVDSFGAARRTAPAIRRLRARHEN